MASKPDLIILDEPTSSLDVSVRMQVIDLLQSLQREHGLAYLFISHDLSVIRHVCNRVSVMYLGRLVETAPAAELFAAPLHPYTQALINAVPVPDPAMRHQRRPLPGEIPSVIDPPPGCRFHPRCSVAIARCRSEVPDLRDAGPAHQVACHLVRRIADPAHRRTVVLATTEFSEETKKAIGGGYRAAAVFFLYFVEELEAHFGKETAHEIARRVVRRKGLAAGNVAADQIGRGGLEELVAAHAQYYPSTRQLEVGPSRYVAEDETCFICAAWRAAGVDPARIRELGDIYCWGDLAYAQAFNPDIRLEFEGRQAEGRQRCRWIFTLPKED